jgi:hypothetical protein
VSFLFLVRGVYPGSSRRDANGTQPGSVGSPRKRRNSMAPWSAARHATALLASAFVRYSIGMVYTLISSGVGFGESSNFMMHP